MRTLRHKGRWGFAFALVCAVSLLACVTQAPEHRLLAKAVQVPEVHPGEDDYYWISGHELLLFHRVRSLRWTLARYDVRSQTERPFPMLEHLFQQTGGQPGSVKISPDHTRLIWAGLGKTIYGAMLDGRQFQQWSYGKKETGISYWLNDSRRFMRLAGNQFFDAQPMVLRDVASPHRVQRLPRRCQQDEVTREYLASLLATQRPPTSVYAEAGAHDGERRDAYVTVSLFGPAGVRGEAAEVPLPPDFFLSERSNPYYLSSGRQLIWTLSSPRVPHQPAWLRELLTLIHGHPRRIRTICLYVSRADGTQWRSVGDWEEPAQLPYYEQQGEKAPGNFRWMPDEKHISFEYRGKLYKIAAD